MMNVLNLVLDYSQAIWLFLGSNPFLLAVMVFSFAIKIYLATVLLIHVRNTKNKHIRRSCFFLILVLCSAMMANSAWILKLVRTMFLPLSYKWCVFWLRIAWTFTVIQFHALALFVESLVEKKNLFGLRQKILLVISGILFFSLLVLSLLALDIPYNYGNIEAQLITNILQYCVFPVLLLSLIVTILKLRSPHYPRLLKLQTSLFIKTMIFPFLILEATNIYPLIKLKDYFGNSYAFASASTLIFAYAIYYCTKKIIVLRFLNLKTHVESPNSFDFIKDFRLVLEQFSNVTSTRELGHITKTFFKEAFNIPAHKTYLYIRQRDANKKTLEDRYKENRHKLIIENALKDNQIPSLLSLLTEPNIVLFFDDIAFNNFYVNKTQSLVTLKLLEELNADALIPIVDRKELIAYIIIERYARSFESSTAQEFYSETERDYMLVFVDHLKNIIKLLHDRTFDTLLSQEKKLREEVFLTHQEINQYKESIRSFMYAPHEKKIGILFFKNRRFIFGNQSAQEMIKIDLNTHSGHPITKQLKNIVQQIIEYKSSQTCIIYDGKDGKFVVSGIPNVEQNNVILTIHYPEISDILRKKIELLNNPTNWSFLLCLETTQTGKLIDQMAPGNGETFLNFKIGLLKAALSKKVVLLDVPEGDLLPIVELLHHTSLRDTLYTLSLNSMSNKNEAAIKLFGINPILEFGKTEAPLLEKLDQNGTLFIQNVHFLNLETQEYLVEVIRYGTYRRLKSDHKRSSNVRIICSTNQNLYTAVQEGTFSKALFDEINNNFLIMPSPISLPEDELDELISLLCKQAIKQEAFENLLGLNEREKRKLLNIRPTSLHELKIKIKQLLVEKSKQHAIDQEENLFDASYAISDPELVEAAQLGKHALRDPRIMRLLWKKFNNQNKIATFLGVNRSSVNRRCKEYDLDK